MFRSTWLQGVRNELKTNASKHLPRRCDKLSRSSALDALLATPQAMAVLSSYVWPLVTQAASTTTAQRSFHLKALLRSVRVELGWGKEACLRRCRTLVWEGIIVRQLHGGAGWQEERPLHDTPTATRISDFFNRATLGSASGASGSAGASSRASPSEASKEPAKSELGRATVVAVHGMRDGVTGREARVEWNVRPLFVWASRAVEETEDAYEAARLERERLSTFEEDAEDADPKTPSKKTVVDHEASIRTWTSVTILSKSEAAIAAIEQWQGEQARRDAAKAEAEQRRAARNGITLPQTGQRALTSFFSVAKTAERSAASVKAPALGEPGPSTSARAKGRDQERSSAAIRSNKQSETRNDKRKDTSPRKATSSSVARPSTPPGMASALRKGKHRAASPDWSDPDESLPSPSTLFAGKSPRKSPRKTGEQRTVRAAASRATPSTPSERALAEVESDNDEDDSVVLVRGPAPPRAKTKPRGSVIVISDSD